MIAVHRNIEELKMTLECSLDGTGYRRSNIFQGLTGKFVLWSRQLHYTGTARGVPECLSRPCRDGVRV